MREEDNVMRRYFGHEWKAEVLEDEQGPGAQVGWQEEVSILMGEERYGDYGCKSIGGEHNMKQGQRYVQV